MRLFLPLVALGCHAELSQAPSQLEQVARASVDGTQILVDDEPFRFVGARVQGLPWLGQPQLPGSTSLQQAFDQLHQLEATVIVFPIAHQEANPWQTSAQLRVTLDAAHEQGLMVIPTFFDADMASVLNPASIDALRDDQGELHTALYQQPAAWTTFAEPLVSANAGHPALLAWSIGSNLPVGDDATAFLSFLETTADQLRSWDANTPVTADIEHTSRYALDLDQEAAMVEPLDLLMFNTHSSIFVASVTRFANDHHKPFIFSTQVQASSFASRPDRLRKVARMWDDQGIDGLVLDSLVVPGTPTLSASPVDLGHDLDAWDMINASQETARSYAGETIWPNLAANAGSSEWMVEHHDQISAMRPRVLVLNYANDFTDDEVSEKAQQIVTGMQAMSTYQGYLDASAQGMLQYQLLPVVSLTDDSDNAHGHLLPIEQPKEGYWGFDYEQLFSAEYAQHLGQVDPVTHQALDLCQLVERGQVHEVWVMTDGDNYPADANMAELLTYKPKYDDQGVRIAGAYSRCAGNGCFDAEDIIPDSCQSTVAIQGINLRRGPGCALHNLGHGMEWTFSRSDTLPAQVEETFRRFAGMDLDERYDLPMESWYSCAYGDEDCLTYPEDHIIDYETRDGSGRLHDYDPVCGNVHFPPNARKHYDSHSPAQVMTSCEDFGQGSDEGQDALSLYSSEDKEAFASLAPDCQGDHLIWWGQHLPGYHNQAKLLNGEDAKNWWVYLYY